MIMLRNLYPWTKTVEIYEALLNLENHKKIQSLSLSFRLKLIPPRGGVSHTDPPSPLVSIISVFFL